MEVDKFQDGGVLTCAVAGDLDVGCAHVLRECVDDCLSERPREFVLDLSGITFIDSSGLATIVDASRRARQLGVDFGVKCGDGKVRQVLQLTHIDQRLRVVD